MAGLLNPFSGGDSVRGDTTKITKKNTTETTTNVSDSSATAAEGALAASGGGVITVNTVDPEITRQAFDFGGAAVAANRDVSTEALRAGVEGLNVAAGIVSRSAQTTSEQTQAALTANAALARGVQTGGASALLEGPLPYVVGAVILVGLFLAFRKK